MFKNTLAWLLLAASGVTQTASAAEVPTAYRHPVLSVQQLDAALGTSLDLARLADEDIAADALGLPPRFAVPERVRLTPARHGTWEKLGNGDLL